MNKTALVITTIAALFAAAWLYLWYNKDRYQFVHYSGARGNPLTCVFDKNTGTVVK